MVLEGEGSRFRFIIYRLLMTAFQRIQREKFTSAINVKVYRKRNDTSFFMDSEDSEVILDDIRMVSVISPTEENNDGYLVLEVTDYASQLEPHDIK